GRGERARVAAAPFGRRGEDVHHLHRVRQRRPEGGGAHRAPAVLQDVQKLLRHLRLHQLGAVLQQARSRRRVQVLAPEVVAPGALEGDVLAGGQPGLQRAAGQLRRDHQLGELEHEQLVPRVDEGARVRRLQELQRAHHLFGGAVDLGERSSAVAAQQVHQDLHGHGGHQVVGRAQVRHQAEELPVVDDAGVVAVLGGEAVLGQVPAQGHARGLRFEEALHRGAIRLAEHPEFHGGTLDQAPASSAPMKPSTARPISPITMIGTQESLPPPPASGGGASSGGGSSAGGSSGGGSGSGGGGSGSGSGSGGVGGEVISKAGSGSSAGASRTSVGSRKRNRVPPTSTSSRSLSARDFTRFLLTLMPLRLPRSSMCVPEKSRRTLACWREARSSLSTMSHDGSRPMMTAWPSLISSRWPSIFPVITRRKGFSALRPFITSFTACRAMKEVFSEEGSSSATRSKVTSNWAMTMVSPLRNRRFSPLPSFLP